MATPGERIGRWRTRCSEWCSSRSNRWFVAAVVMALILRVAWAIWTTRSPSNPLSDPAQYQRLAEDLVDRHSPRFNGRPTAFWPPGWPMALAPFVWLSFKTGLLSTALAGSLFNAVSGTATVVFAALLAAMWGGPSARNPTAWLMALSAGPIFYTSSLLAETWYALLVVTTLWVATVVVRNAPTRRQLLLLGALIGYTSLVRGVGLALLAAPALVLRGSTGAWKGALRATGAVLVGLVVVLAPWTIRNGIQVGVWTPTSTNNATQLCMGNRPGGDGTYDVSAEVGNRCFRHSPYDDATLYDSADAAVRGVEFRGPDEPRFYADVTATTMSWMVRHPLDQLRLVPRKTFEIFREGSGGLNAAEDFGDHRFARGEVRNLLASLENASYWAVVTLAVLALVAVPSARRAWPIWGLAVLQWAVTCLGIGLDRYQHPVTLLLTVLAGMAVAAARQPDLSSPSVDDGAPPPR